MLSWLAQLSQKPDKFIASFHNYLKSANLLPQLKGTAFIVFFFFKVLSLRLDSNEHNQLLCPAPTTVPETE